MAFWGWGGIFDEVVFYGSGLERACVESRLGGFFFFFGEGGGGGVGMGAGFGWGRGFGY